MDTVAIVQLLISERDRLSAAITALKGTPQAKRRGRPPKNPQGQPAWLTGTTTAPAAAPAKKARKKRTAAQKKAQAERMKAYWAAKKKAK